MTVDTGEAQVEDPADDPADGPADDRAGDPADGSTHGAGHESDGPAGPGGRALRRLRARLATIHPAAWTVGILSVAFAVVFGRLGVQHHQNFGTWAFDMAIYDQGFWLVSQGGQSFVTVRGLEFWGHHVNLVVLAFVPFYWLGAGPSFLYVAQAAVLGAGAIPTYLIARDRFGPRAHSSVEASVEPSGDVASTVPPTGFERLGPEWIGAVFAVAYLLYAPVQWIAWANFHPEALVITPFLFAWWFARRGRWLGFWIALVIALSTREDTALAVFVLGGVLWWMFRRAGRPARDQWMAFATVGVGALWYLVSTRFVIPYFNQGEQPFYVGYFFGHYGDSMPEIAREMLARPDRVISDATQPDRLRFYRDLFLPLGGLPLAAPLQLLMAVPQMLASVIGLSPYARTIRFQYTSVMVAPIVIASIQGAWLLWRFRFVRRVLVPWLLVCAYVTNVAWSPSPWGANDDVWARPEPRHEALREAIDLVPDDASVTATFALVPHLAHREQIYDWPNPWQAAYWGNDDEFRLPDPAEIDVVVLDRRHVGSAQQDLLEQLVGPDGEFEILFDRDEVVVGRRP